MAESNQKNLPSFASLDAMVEFFDEHDMGDYLEEMPEVQFDVNLQRRMHLVAIDDEIVSQLTEIARQEHVASEALVNSWLKEKISSYSEKA
ncbi:MAG: hypothetical protein QOH25_3274 [Acidobacteriota bacterium]|jgi:hypothetical protein|nr:hypothetical protein [Acidobacteriota bacterium]